MQSLGPRPAETAELRSDLTGALEAEIREQEQFFVEEELGAETPAAENQYTF